MRMLKDKISRYHIHYTEFIADETEPSLLSEALNVVKRTEENTHHWFWQDESGKTHLAITWREEAKTKKTKDEDFVQPEFWWDK